jgi:hypothetical protein
MISEICSRFEGLSISAILVVGVAAMCLVAIVVDVLACVVAAVRRKK